MIHLATIPSEAKPLLALSVLLILLIWETLHPFFSYLSGSKRLTHGVKNMVLGILNGLMTTLCFMGLWWLAAAWAEKHGFGLLHWLTLPSGLEWIIAILLLDSWTYLWHRMNHQIPFLWRFHRVHHLDPQMDVTTANRFHIGEIFMSSILRVPLIALLGLQLEQLALYEFLMFAVVQFHHANVSLSEKWDRLLRLIIVTPFMHKVHHSRWQPETDSNYAAFLSIWDRIFRSFRTNAKPGSIQIGLDGFDAPEQQSFTSLLKNPMQSKSKPRL